MSSNKAYECPYLGMTRAQQTDSAHLRATFCLAFLSSVPEIRTESLLDLCHPLKAGHLSTSDNDMNFCQCKGGNSDQMYQWLWRHPREKLNSTVGRCLEYTLSISVFLLPTQQQKGKETQPIICFVSTVPRGLTPWISEWLISLFLLVTHWHGSAR